LSNRYRIWAVQGLFLIKGLPYKTYVDLENRVLHKNGAIELIRKSTSSLLNASELFKP